MGSQVTQSTIGVHREPAREPGAGGTGGNLAPILAEIHQGLCNLNERRERSLIDLQALPLSDAEKSELLGILGEGEASARLQALGPSRLWETGFASVWVVEHCNEAGERVALQLEIDEVPELLKSQAGDVTDGIERLGTLIRGLREAGQATSRGDHDGHR